MVDYEHDGAGGYDDGLMEYRLGAPEEIGEAEAALEGAEASGDKSGWVLAFYRLAALLPLEQVTVTWSRSRRPYAPGFFRRWPIEFHAGRYRSRGAFRASRGRRRYFPNIHSDKIDPYD